LRERWPRNFSLAQGTVSWPDSINLIYHAEHSWFTTIDGVAHSLSGSRRRRRAAADSDSRFHFLRTWFGNEVFLRWREQAFASSAPDLPGYGYSDKPVDGEYTIAAQARAVLGLMDRLEIDRATIVGASYGGAVAALLALDSPERVAKLVLVGAVSNDEPKQKLLLRLASVPLLGDLATPLFSARAGSYASALRTCTGASDSLSTNASSRRAIICWRRRTRIAP